MLWIDIKNIADGHSAVISRVPYPMECWVSKENKKTSVKSPTSATHGLHAGFSTLIYDQKYLTQIFKDHFLTRNIYIYLYLSMYLFPLSTPKPPDQSPPTQGRFLTQA